MSEPTREDAGPVPPASGAVFERLALSACAALVVVAIWTPAALPLVDLPQHTAQLALWERMQDPSWRFADRFELDWGTPYFAYYLLGRALAAPLGVEAAVRCLVTLAALALPLALRHLLRRRGGDPLLAVLGFPLALGFPFAMGFLNYILALPLALLMVAEAGEQAARPTRRGALALAALSVVCFLAHALAWAVAVAIGGAAAWGAGATWRARLRAGLTLALAAPLALTWLARREEPIAPLPFVWGGGPARALQLPAVLLGDDTVALAFGVAGVVAVGLGVRRLSRDPARWAPAAAAAALFALGPMRVLGVSFVAQRLGVLVPLLLLLALDPAPSSRRRRAAVALVPLLAFAQVAVVAHRLWRCGQDGADVMALAAHLPDGAVVYGHAYDLEPKFHAQTRAYDHFAVLAQRDHDVLVEPTFARHPPQLVRYRPDHEPEGRDWTHLLLRLTPERLARPMPEFELAEGSRWRVVAESGAWRLYARSR